MSADFPAIPALLPTAPEAVSLANAGAKDSPGKIRDAAAQFEALLIGQILKMVHEEESDGWLGAGEDQTSSSAMGLADEYFARAMAARGGLGLAKMVEAGLEKQPAAGGPEPLPAPIP